MPQSHPPTVALFGAKGEMGRFLLAPLLEKRSHLIRIDRESSARDLAKAWKTDIIILSIPRDAVDGLLQGIRLSKKQLLIEICSVKRGIGKAMQKTGATTLSLHPMNGPHTPWSQQKWLVIGKAPKHHLATWFLDLLRNKRVYFHRIRSEGEHDLLMSIVLGIPELLTLFLDTFFKKCRARKAGRVSLGDALKTSSPAFASLFLTHLHTISSTPLWLREDLLKETHPSFLPTCKEVFEELLDDHLYDHINPLFRAQQRASEKIDTKGELIPSIRQRTYDDFNFLNAFFLGEGIKRHTELYVQKSCTKDDILLPATKVRVGIHGLRGSFTDEAWHRFATEVLEINEKEYEVRELIHARNVIRAVHEGEVDRGIFAFANSGSGGYTASIEAMGEYPYELLASFTMPINMCILGHPKVEHVHELERFYGHPIAILQCRKTLAQRWPDIPLELMTDEMDTALSAKLLKEGKIPSKKGVFASKRAAAIYGLRVLAEGVHHDPHNATAFAVIKRKERSKGSR